LNIYYFREISENLFLNISYFYFLFFFQKSISEYFIFFYIIFRKSHFTTDFLGSLW